MTEASRPLDTLLCELWQSLLTDGLIFKPHTAQIAHRNEAYVLSHKQTYGAKRSLGSEL